jgi:hypothetical protein
MHNRQDKCRYDCGGRPRPLTQALRLDLVGPERDEPQIDEVLSVPPSRWYLTGFPAPWSAPGFLAFRVYARPNRSRSSSKVVPIAAIRALCALGVQSANDLHSP